MSFAYDSMMKAAEDADRQNETLREERDKVVKTSGEYADAVDAWRFELAREGLGSEGARAAWLKVESARAALDEARNEATW